MLLLQLLVTILVLVPPVELMAATEPRPVVRIIKNRNITSLKIPESYEFFMEKEKARLQVIPEKAQHAKDEGQFLTTVLDHNFKTYLKENPDSGLQSLKALEDAVNTGGDYKTDSFRFQSKLNIAKGSAELNISYLLDSRIWFENKFSTVNAELDFYATDATRFGLDFHSDREDTRTQLGFKLVW